MGEQLTESDVKKIKEEIEYRKIVVRKKELEAVKEARAQGDLSENFEYKAAKQDKNRNESRIRYLERMLKNAKIVSDTSKADEVGINNTIEVYFEDDDETETYRLVTSIRGNSLQGLISIESPLGKAIQGHKVGDRVLVKTNGNDGYYIVIKNIDNTTDDSHDTCQRRERKVADRADVSEKQVDLSFFDCHAFERSCQCQALEVAGHVDGKIGNT